MQDVVAVIGHQYRILLVQVENPAQRITLLSQQVHTLDVTDQSQAITFGQSGVRRVRYAAKQRQVQIQHPRQGAFVKRQAAGGQQGQGHQIDRVDCGRFIEVACNLLTQA
ncbi:hypothetical protein D3C85_1424000 [compost metagenome]